MAAAKPRRRAPTSAIANGKADVEGGVIQVAARTSGVVREVLVQEGDDVTKGQVLARLEDDQPRLAAERRGRRAPGQAQVPAAGADLHRQARVRPPAAADAKATSWPARRSTRRRTPSARPRPASRPRTPPSPPTQAKLNQAQYNQELTIIRAPADGRIVRRYANPGAGASTLNVSNMFDLEPKANRIVRAEISESALPFVLIGQNVQLVARGRPDQGLSPARCCAAPRCSAPASCSRTTPPRRPTNAWSRWWSRTDGAPFLIGQRVLVKFMKKGEVAGAKAVPAPKKA